MCLPSCLSDRCAKAEEKGDQGLLQLQKPHRSVSLSVYAGIRLSLCLYLCLPAFLPAGFAAACPPDSNTAKQPKEVFGVFVAQQVTAPPPPTTHTETDGWMCVCGQGTDSPGLTWIEGVTLVPPHEFFTSLLAFSRHHYDIHLQCEFTLHKGTVLKG